MWDDRVNRYDMMDGGGVVMGVGLVALLLVVVLVVLVLAFAVLYPRQSSLRVSQRTPAEPEARRLLDRRLALGELTPEEHATIREALDA